MSSLEDIPVFVGFEGAPVSRTDELPARIAGTAEDVLEWQMQRCVEVIEGRSKAHKWVDSVTGELFDTDFLRPNEDFVFEPADEHIVAKGREAGQNVEYAGLLTREEAHTELRIRREALERTNYFMRKKQRQEDEQRQKVDLEKVDVSPRYL